MPSSTRVQAVQTGSLVLKKKALQTIRTSGNTHQQIYHIPYDLNLRNVCCILTEHNIATCTKRDTPSKLQMQPQKIIMLGSHSLCVQQGQGCFLYVRQQQEAPQLYTVLCATAVACSHDTGIDTSELYAPHPGASNHLPKIHSIKVSCCRVAINMTLQY